MLPNLSHLQAGQRVLICFMPGITYPSLAILFSRTMDAFSAVDVEKGNFYSLMFFVVALGNAMIYAAGGWVANVISQVSSGVWFSRGYSTMLKTY